MEQELATKVSVATGVIRNDPELYRAYREFLNDHRVMVANFPAAALVAFAAGWKAKQLDAKHAAP